MELALAKAISNLVVLLFRSLYGHIEKFFSSVQIHLQTFFPKLFSTKWNHFWGDMQFCNTLKDEEMNVLMDRLGIVCGLEGIKGISSFGVEDFMSLFEEEEPSLDEIKETFGVFDVNNDGFIDASELHRVVCNLGLKEKCELGECKEMIKAFDGNGDGVIDFQEFVKFMEKCLC